MRIIRYWRVTLNFLAVTLGFYVIATIAVLMFVAAVMAMGATFGDANGFNKIRQVFSGRGFWLFMVTMASVMYLPIAILATSVGWKVQRMVAGFFGYGRSFVARKIRFDLSPPSLMD